MSKPGWSLVLGLGAASLFGCGDNLAPTSEPTTTIDLVGPAALATEGGDLTLTARRTGSLDGEVTVTYAARDGSATMGADYGAASGTLTWGPADGADKTFTVRLIDDLQIEGPESVVVELSAPSAGVELGSSVVMLTITDDDRVGDSFALTSAGRVVTFDRATPSTLTSAAALTGLASGEVVLGVDVRPANGLLYALTGAGRLYTVDPATGAATLASTLVADPADTTSPFTALAGTALGVDFNPVVDRLRVVSDTGQNLRINVTTGATTTDGAINGATAAYAAAAYSNSFAVACRTTLYALDAATDRLLVQSPPNDGTTVVVGPLGLDATAISGFDVAYDASGAQTALAALTVGGARGLYAINLTTGAATQVAPLGIPAEEALGGFAVRTLPAATTVAQPPGELYGLTETSALISFNRAAPAKLCTSRPLTGLTAGDVVVGIDVRPSTGLLYALTNNAGTGRLYIVDPATAAAATPVVLSAALVGAEFGMDFNPTGPVALRVVSSSGQNLRVTDLATGATTTDGALNGAGTTAIGAAYTDSVAGAGTTALYIIDATADRLRLQSPPNAGTLVDIGGFGVDLGDVTAFDIDGRDNSALIAVGSGTMSTLHTVDLATGAASPSLGTVGGGQRLRGLTRTTPTTTVFGLTTGNALVRLSLADPSMVTAVGPITGLVGGESLLGIDVRPSTGLLHGLGAQGGVYVIDPGTAAATRLGTLTADPGDLTSPFTGLTGAEFGIDFNPTGPVALRVISDAEQNLRIPNVATPATLTDQPLARSTRAYALGAAAYANNIPGATTTTLYAVDRLRHRLVTVVPPNNGFVREIGALGIDATTATSFEIAGPATALAILDGAGSKNLVTIDLATGAATVVGAINLAGTVVGLAAPATATAPAAGSLVYAVTDGNVLASFARNAPGAVTSIGTIAVGAGEILVGLDVRPSTGELWLLTRDLAGTGRLYTVDLATAVATQQATLIADVTDPTAPYAALAGNAFAVDFNPTGPVALRVVSDTGQNLRIANPLTGATFTDGSIGLPTAIDATAAAYTNSFVAPAGVVASTALYVIDVTAGSLMLQAPPNDGVLTPVGALSPSASFADPAVAGASGFDIAGGNNGVALAALQRPTTTPGLLETFSRLYRINLATGAATELGTGIGGAPLRGLAIQIR